jgi:hypothetical protein
MKPYTQNELLQHRDRHERWLKTRPGVVNTSIGLSRSGDPALKVYHTKDMTADVRREISSKLGGIPLEFEEKGPGDEVIPY